LSTRHHDGFLIASTMRQYQRLSASTRLIWTLLANVKQHICVCVCVCACVVGEPWPISQATVFCMIDAVADARCTGPGRERVCLVLRRDGLLRLRCVEPSLGCRDQTQAYWRLPSPRPPYFHLSPIQDKRPRQGFHWSVFANDRRHRKVHRDVGEGPWPSP